MAPPAGPAANDCHRARPLACAESRRCVSPCTPAPARVIGMEVFAERARTELLATGENVRPRTVETRDDLTAQCRPGRPLGRGHRRSDGGQGASGAAWDPLEHAGILPAGVAQRFKPLDVRPRRPTSRPNSRLATRTSALCTRRGSATPFRWRWSCRPLWDLRLHRRARRLDDPSATTAITSRPGRSLSTSHKSSARRSAHFGDPLFTPLHMPPLGGPTEWLNSKPLDLAELRGHVVVVDFWTLTCTR